MPPPIPDPSQLSRSDSIETLPFDEAAVSRIANLLEVDVAPAPFRMPGAAVWRLTVPGTQGRPPATVTLWPGIGRVDVLAGPATVVFTDIRKVELVPGVEVQFRRGTQELLVVARGGRVIVRA